jgi:hypothetical protein
VKATDAIATQSVILSLRRLRTRHYALLIAMPAGDERFHEYYREAGHLIIYAASARQRHYLAIARIDSRHVTPFHPLRWTHTLSYAAIITPPMPLTSAAAEDTIRSERYG